MPLPRPEAGLVVCYEFLWSHEFDEGARQGLKKRPCAIVLSLAHRGGGPIVTVAPITHLEPKHSIVGIELPPRVKRHLGLDTARSWVIVSELNTFEWPGFDLYPIPGGPPGRFDYGFLPPRFFEEIKARIALLDAAMKRVVQRRED